MPKKLTQEEFKNQLLNEHPELELLSKYDGNKKFITVRCTKHDYTFKTKPNWLHRGCGCKKCYDERRGDSTRKTTEEFIKDARLVHGDKYDYSNVVYVNNHTPVKIICKNHGMFLQTPDKHVSSCHGCPMCAGRNKTTSSVINEFKKIHKDDYLYDKVNYVNNRTKVCIICQKHGEFWQTPDKHLQGQGCPLCNESKLEQIVRHFFTEGKFEFESQKHFAWLGKQSIDFYLPKYDVGIECQGEQHFSKSYGIFLEKSSLEKRICMDITKKTLCDENNIQMIYIMSQRCKKKAYESIFNGIYTENNIILDTELNRLTEKIEKIKGLL